MKRFGNLFIYQTTNFDGRYINCKLLEDIISNEGRVFAFACETFSIIKVDLNTSQIHFFEEFDEHIPIFTIHFKI